MRPGLLLPLFALFFCKQFVLHPIKTKMFKVLILSLLLLYFWYFYISYSKPVPKPTAGAPLKPPKYNVELVKKAGIANTFQFVYNNTVLWEHTLPDAPYLFRKGLYDVIKNDPCYYVPNTNSIPAKGQVLYDFLKKSPDILAKLSFQEDSPYTIQDADVFYFTCMNKQIQSLGICPSGHVFQKNRCLPINLCTGKPDDTYLPDPNRPHHYIKCFHGKEMPKYCGNDYIFFHNRCVSMNELVHYCKHDTTGKPVKLDDRTMVHCQNGQPQYTRCEPGTQFFKNDYCEPADCVKQADGTKLPLPERTLEPFSYIPGYMTCFGEKVDEIIECPQFWNDMKSKGENLTHLPMVFDGSACSIPSLCENVQPTDEDVYVPVHEFTKHVRNWNLSERYDAGVGYTCEGKGVKRRNPVDPGKRINKKFRLEDACESPAMMLPVADKPEEYYKCEDHTQVACPAGAYFNGLYCTPKPENAFKYNNLPLFNFDSLNFESWIKPWDYVNPPPKRTCKDPESIYVQLYDLCSHPDCVNYAFLSMIPNLQMFLPNEEYKCHYYYEGRLAKEDAKHKHHFWNQTILRPELTETEKCDTVHKIQTGNFIWDSTVYATCDPTQPFVFCPSVHTKDVIKVDQYYACEVPDSNLAMLRERDGIVQLAQNEVKSILPIDVGGLYKLNRGDYEILPQAGYVLDETDRYVGVKDKPANLELRYRVTHPPNVAFNYEQNRYEHSSKTRGFLMKKKDFSSKSLNFPKYSAQAYVTAFKDIHDL